MTTNDGEIIIIGKERVTLNEIRRQLAKDVAESQGVSYERAIGIVLMGTDAQQVRAFKAKHGG